MKFDIETVNKLIKSINTGDTEVSIVEMEYFPKFNFVGDDFVQTETYKVKLNCEYIPKYIEDKIQNWLKITLIWEDSLV